MQGYLRGYIMLVIPKELAQKLMEQAEGEAPMEACGVLAGSRGEEGIVERVYECENADPVPEANYEIPPGELLRAIKDIEEQGLEVLGFYHSHPMALSQPSATDAARATWPGHSYVIVSPSSEDSITSWVWNEERGFLKEEVKIR